MDLAWSKTFKNYVYIHLLICFKYHRTITLGFQSIRNGDYRVIVAGGQESMSTAEHCTQLRGTKMGALNLVDTLLHDGLTDSFYNVHMGNTGKYNGGLKNNN